MAILVVPISQVSASVVINGSTNESKDIQSRPPVEITDELINKVNPYILIKDNQYVLDPNVKSILTTDQYNAFEMMISESNTQIKNAGAVINLTDKSYSVHSLQPRNSHYTSKYYSWGTRYYFTSNKAVYNMDHDLETGKVACGILSIINSIAVLGSAYCQKMESDLSYMNNIHPHNYLHMDINKYNLTYKINTGLN